jgi:transcriptional regulator with XRE-family HTH domain
MTNEPHPTSNFARALKFVRNFKHLSQESFGLVSSRTYVSSLERNLKSPTLSKIEALAKVMNVHPLSLMTLTYLQNINSEESRKLLDEVFEEISELIQSGPPNKDVQPN